MQNYKVTLLLQLASPFFKDDLEDYGRTVGIELDRRHNKAKLITELTDHIKKI